MDNNVPGTQAGDSTGPEIEMHEHSQDDVIELDSGAKWKVVPEMMKHIRNMESQLNEFSIKNNHNIKDFHSLSSNLQQEIDQLTAKCTMEGKAHDELHKWLVPYIDTVSELKKTNDIESANKTLNDLQGSFLVFNVFFE